MINTIYEVAAVAAIGTPILAWVVRVEKKISQICVTLKHIRYLMGREEEDVPRGE